jgi:hypothetical protein
MKGWGKGEKMCETVCKGIFQSFVGMVLFSAIADG